MKIASYQMELIPGQPEKNRKKVQRWVEQVCADEEVDVCVLPEMWTTAYTLPELEEILTEDQGVTEAFLQDLARRTKVNIVAGSIAVKENGNIFNRSLILDRKGSIIHTYDKMHLVPMLDEHLYLKGGLNSGKVFELDGRKMGLVICYDLRFPELIRSLALQGAEVVFVVAEWPEARALHWEILQQARAIENQVYMVSCNCVGTYNNVEFAGRSMITNPWGEVLAKASGKEQETIVRTLNLDEVTRIRKEVPVFSSRVPHLYETH
ncbi:carbon-nitrogen family hydrolase [Halalkalibacter akibai]|uniref:Aliphatic amidase amiE n=1 Tax=Halalkalibacter akibai (strain ATCC 43226 / DSM 21942 / CIP 109018 / JCM 9157 / 1139) TaxID=1236973 RepID=W4QYQ2_HALA3|nr:carbon-nitrogen family hydrolase [Halalkalibacter akibai]GAE37027.1 aliphatic amidase amiE [Halalkalibacter akibai JCM 9157]